MGRQLVGFDIGESTLKMVHASGREIKNCVVADVPDNTVKNGAVVSMDAMADFIRESARKNDIPKADAAVIIPASQILTKNVTMPAMNVQQLMFNLPFELKDYLKEEKQNYFFDYALREMVTDDEGRPYEMRLLICAVLKSVIEEYEIMFKRAGFKLKTAVPEECAYANIVNSASDRLAEDFCIADLGHSSTRLHIFHKGEYAAMRNIDIGGRNLDMLIADESGIDIHMAQIYKKSNYNVVLESDLALVVYNRLTVEIMKAVNFFNYNNREAELNDIYICGGGAEVDILVRTIAEETKLNVYPASKLTSRILGLDKPDIFLKSCGLVIGG